MSAASGEASGEQLADGPLQSLIERDSRQKLCGGKVLLRFRLASNEVASLKEPPPLFSLTSRLAYLPVLFCDVYEHFKSCAPPRFAQARPEDGAAPPWGEIWFDFDGTPLKWHYPIGVLCDVLVGLDVPTPLDLTVHFRGSSSPDVQPFSGIGDLQQVVMSAFRQAVFLQQGTTAPFMRLPKQQQTLLWDSICRGDQEAYADVQRQLLCPSLSKCKSLAVRLHLCAPGSRHQVLLHPAPPLDEAVAVSLGAFLLRALPPVLDHSAALLEGLEVLAHGVSVPLDTPLYWLQLHAAHLDQFVHLVVRLPAEEGCADGAR